MAFTACDLHGQMYRGGASTVFLALVNGVDRKSKRVKLCKDCMTLTLDDIDSHLYKVSEGDTFFDQPEFLGCSWDGSDISNRSTAFFATVYPRGMSERQYYGQLCDSCRDLIAQRWALK